MEVVRSFLTWRKIHSLLQSWASNIIAFQALALLVTLPREIFLLLTHAVLLALILERICVFAASIYKTLENLKHFLLQAGWRASRLALQLITTLIKREPSSEALFLLMPIYTGPSAETFKWAWALILKPIIISPIFPRNFI